MIHYNLFRLLMEHADSLPTSEEQNETRQKAIKILSQNSNHLPYGKLPKNFKDEMDLDDDLNSMFTKVLQSMSRNLNQILVIKYIQEIEKHN